MKDVKTCQECEMEFRSKGAFSRHKSLTATVRHGNDISVVAKQK